MPRPDIAEHLPIKPLRLILGVIACIGIAATVFTLVFGFMTIPANSVGVRTRFGSYHDIVNPGLTYAIPYVDEIHIVPTQRLQKLEFGFSTPGATNLYQGDPQPEETETMITGDLNTALVPWVVQYRITDPRMYLFGAREPEKPLRDQIHSRISNPILDHPRHERGVQIPRNHRLSFLRLRIALIKICRTRGRKTELELLQTLRRYDVNLVDVWNGIGQTRVHEVVVSAKPGPHPNRVCGNGHEPKHQREERGRNSDARDDTKNQSQRFNREMFGNVRSRHKRLLLTQSSHG